MAKNGYIGVGYALAAYLSWGFFPLYWKLLQGYSSHALLFHRCMWSFILLTLYRRSVFIPNLKQIRLLALSSLFIGINWFFYVYAVQTHRVIEASLGYFINPLFNILIGRFFLNEKLSGAQKFAVSSAALGVAIIGSGATGVPWIALGLATTFCLYGLAKRDLRTSALEALHFETLMILIPTAAIVMSLLLAPNFLSLALIDSPGRLFPDGVFSIDMLLLVGSGLITTLPLFWFAQASRNLSFSILGLFQFLSPSIQFLIGLLAFGEPMDLKKMVGFVFIWLGLLFVAIPQAAQIFKNPSLK